MTKSTRVIFYIFSIFSIQVGASDQCIEHFERETTLNELVGYYIENSNDPHAMLHILEVLGTLETGTEEFYNRVQNSFRLTNA